MIIWFRKFFLLLTAALILLLFSPQVYAFIPEGTDIIKLATEKIVEPSGLKVEQKRKIFPGQKKPEDTDTAVTTKAPEETAKEGSVPDATASEEISLDTGSAIQEESIIDEEPVETEPAKQEPLFVDIAEKLWFSYPGKFRSESVSGSHDMICVESKGQFLKIIDEFIESKEKSLTDLYTDILLFRQAESLQERLSASGVDISLSSLKRHDGMIYFVVGAPPTEDQPSSSLWIEKDTSFPGRYTIKKNGLFVDIFYKDWQKVSRTWYPMQIIIYLDGMLFSRINVVKFELEADFETNFFNIKRLMGIFPESSNFKNESESHRDESDELEKSIKEFKKLYE